MAPDKGMIAGAFHGWVARRTSTGFPMGVLATPEAPVAGSTYNAYRIVGYVENTAPEATIEEATRVAGQSVKGKRQLGISDLGSLTLTLSDYDESFHAMVTDSLVDETTMTDWPTTSPNFNLASRPQLILCMTTGFQTDSGDNQYANYLYHNVQIAPVIPGGSQSGGVNPNPMVYTVTPSKSSRTGLGRLYSAAALNVVDDSDIMQVIRTQAPIFVTTFIKDAADTTIQLPYLPTSSGATGAAGNSIVDDVGATLAVTSVVTTTGIVTLAAAGVSGHKVVVGFQTDYVTP
jgi:hypothetical protein